jgi:hypothetical protein
MTPRLYLVHEPETPLSGSEALVGGFAVPVKLSLVVLRYGVYAIRLFAFNGIKFHSRNVDIYIGRQVRSQLFPFLTAHESRGRRSRSDAKGQTLRAASHDRRGRPWLFRVARWRAHYSRRFGRNAPQAAVAHQLVAAFCGRCPHATAASGAQARGRLRGIQC